MRKERKKEKTQGPRVERRKGKKKQVQELALLTLQIALSFPEEEPFFLRSLWLQLFPCCFLLSGASWRTGKTRRQNNKARAKKREERREKREERRERGTGSASEL